MYEDEQANVERSVLVDMLLASLQRLESRIRKKYYGYPYREIEVPKYYQNHPYSYDEVGKLLKIIYGLLKKLEGYLKSKGTYDYYYPYFKEYHQLLNELLEYYGIKSEELEEDELTLLTEREKKEYELLKDLGEQTNHPELPEQYLQKVKWSRMSIEEKLERLIDRWWQQKKKREKLSKELTYAGKTVEEWIQELDLRDKGEKLARKKPWLLADPSQRDILKKIDKGEIWYDD